MEAALQPKAQPITVLIVDDEPLFVEMVSAVLGADERIEIVATASNGRDGVELAVSLAPDVTLMDISMPILDGIEAVRRIRERRPKACILMLTGSNAPAEIDRSRQAGAAAFLTKDRLGAQLVDAVLDLGRR